MALYQICSKEGVNYVEIALNNETVRAESGAMRYMLGNITMESKAPSLGGFFKAAVTGESIFRPTYTGTGKLVLEPTIYNFFELNLQGEELVLDQGAYWCSDASIDVSARANKLAAGVLSGEGMFQTVVRGVGKVILMVPGPVEIIDLANQKLVVDGTFAVARSASLNFRVEKSTKSILGGVTGGEGLVNVFEGSGRVWLCPVPNVYVMLQNMIGALAMSRTTG
ncbi:MAG: AIM24 family protein [Fimbriimonadaceae bacterium]|jgi:uncharacterized protein (AIM24 family)|nr:AIM24 family protein [Fimbriimonadaceae bacterium]